jgi:RsmE family RNA methyltransferase
MHRFYLPPAASQNSRLTLTDQEAHHAVNVLRVREHERVVVLNGAGDEFLCEVLSDNADSKVEKWEATAIESIKQCGSAWLPRIEPPLTPQAFLARNEKNELTLIASLQGDSRHPRDRFNSFLKEHQFLPESVFVWIGPEGDFTPAEINAIRAAGALPITLGPLVLRSETAAIYCLSVINYELQSPRS